MQDSVCSQANKLLVTPNKVTRERKSTMRQAYSGLYGQTPQNVMNTGISMSDERLMNIKRAVDSIEQRLNASAMNQPSAAPQTPTFAMAQHPNHPMHQATFAGQNQQTAPQPTSNSAQLNLLQEEIARLSSQIMAPAHPNPPMQDIATGHGHQGFAPNINSATAEIAQRQQMLRKAAPQMTMGVPNQNAQQTALQESVQTAARDSIADALAELKAEMAEIRQHVEKPIAVKQDVPQEEIDRIAKAVADMQNGSHVDEEAFDRLQNELESLRDNLTKDLRSNIAEDIQHSTDAMQGSMEQVNNSMTSVRDEIHQATNNQVGIVSARIDALAQGIDQMSLQSGNSIAPAVENLTTQLDTLRMSVEDLPQTLAMSRLEERLQDMSAKIEAFAQMAQQPAAVGAGLTAEDLGALEARMDEIARGLVAVSNSGNKAPEVDLTAVDRVEARMSELGRTIDMISQRDNAAEFEQLAVRIDGLTERLGSFEKYAENGDLGGASAMFAAPDIGVIEEQLRTLTTQMEHNAGQIQTQQLEEQIQRLSDRIEQQSLQPHAGVETIEAQIQQLYARVEEAANVNSTAAQMSNLEAQIGQIIRTMNKQPEGVATGEINVDFAPMEARLGQIENQLVENQSFSLEAAQQAAQQAVSMMGSSSEAGQIISALSADLQSLQAVSEAGNANNAQTVSEVHSTLNHVIDRLNTIEGSIAQVAETREATFVSPAATVAAHQLQPETQSDMSAFAADGLADTVSEDMGAIQRAAVETGFVEAPSVDPTDHIEAALPLQPETMEDHSPLEPGSGAPDIEKLVQQATAKLDATKANLGAAAGSLDDAVPTDEMRTDAVSAARRALQATTAEMNAVREETKSAGKSAKPKLDGLKSKAGGVLSGLNIDRLRKPVVMTAAALLLAIVALKGYSMFAGGDETPVAQLNSPAIEQTVDGTASSVEGTLDGVVDEAANIGGGVVDGANRVVRSVGDGVENTVSEVIDKAESVLEDKSPADTNAAPEGDAVQASAPIENNTEEPVDVETPATEGQVDVPSNAGPAALVAAASSGDSKALFQLGIRYSDGKDTKRNMGESAKWFEVAANQGFAPAQYSIGSLYEKGIGVKRDLSVASDWYSKAAAQGNARAMHNLAVINAMGNPPEKKADIDTAVTWFQQAADLGIKDSQFNLGILYGQGQGVPQNLKESYKWFALAAKTGDTDASKKRDEVANAMDPDDLDAAREVVNGWKPKKLVEEANRVTAPKSWLGSGSGGAKSAADGAQGLVQKAQAMLNSRGFEVGTPDGVMGPKTRNAIREFQRSAGIPVTGKVDGKLLSALGLQT